MKSGTQEVRVILTDYVSLSAFRKIVIQEKFEWGKKNKRARDDDESKTIREFLRGVWLVFSGVEADEKQINRVFFLFLFLLLGWVALRATNRGHDAGSNTVRTLSPA